MATEDLARRARELLSMTGGSASRSLNQLVVSGLNAADFNSIMGSSAIATGAGAKVWGQTGSAAK